MVGGWLRTNVRIVYLSAQANIIILFIWWHSPDPTVAVNVVIVFSARVRVFKMQ